MIKIMHEMHENTVQTEVVIVQNITTVLLYLPVRVSLKHFRESGEQLAFGKKCG